MQFFQWGKEINISIITSLSAIVVALLSGYFAIKLKNIETNIKTKLTTLSNEQDELQFLNIYLSYRLVNKINNNINTLFRESSVDRTLIAFTTNGSTDYNYINVCLENNKNGLIEGDYKNYLRLKVDNPLRDMLKIAERDTNYVISTNNLPEGVLKNIYESREARVTETVCSFLTRLKIKDRPDIILFSITQTLNPERFSKKDIFKIKATVSIIIGDMKDNLII